MPAAISSLFPHRLGLEPAGDLAAVLAAVPARWAVYLFLDAAGAPFQLLCVKNLRASLTRRLAAGTELAPRVPYRDVVRGVAWQRVDSAFEADLLYAAAARAFFPSAYRQFVESRRPWFMEIDPRAHAPSFTRTQEPKLPASCFGPLASRSAAQRLIEEVTDAFDLCRYPHLLAQSPAAVACPYKQMHKCPAPCDGSVPLSLYCMQVDLAIDFLGAPLPVIEQHAQRMQAAAAALEFESAGGIKRYLQQLQGIADLNLHRLRDMRYLALLRGPAAQTAKLYLVSPAGIHPLLSVRRPGLEDCQVALDVALADPCVSAASALPERDGLALLSHQLLHPTPDTVLLRLHELNAVAVHAALTELLRRKPAPEPPTEEGVVRDAH
jgi:hypothetical protein